MLEDWEGDPSSELTAGSPVGIAKSGDWHHSCLGGAGGASAAITFYLGPP
jgi:hypothetical protein